MLRILRAPASISFAEFGDGAIVHDGATSRAHRIGPIAAYVLAAAMDGIVDVEELTREFATVHDADPSELAAVLRSTVDGLREAALLVEPGRSHDHATAAVAPARRRPEPVRPSITAPAAGWTVGRTHPYLEKKLAICGPDPGLIAMIDEFLGDPVSGEEPDTLFAVQPDDDHIELIDDSRWRFSSPDQLLRQLPNALNLFAGRSTRSIVLHAGAVRTRDGRIIAITGTIDAGKSTLVGALVRSGADYLGDEAIAIDTAARHLHGYPKPLTLSPESQGLLGLQGPPDHPTAMMHRRADEIRDDASAIGGRIGPIDLIVNVRHDRAASITSDRLEPEPALRMLLENTLNPDLAGSSGLRTLVKLAESVPVVHIRHGDAIELAHRLLTSAPPA